MPDKRRGRASYDLPNVNLMPYTPAAETTRHPRASKVQAMAVKPNHLAGGIPRDSKLGWRHVCGLIRSSKAFSPR